MKRIILNADDFGLTPCINEAVLDGAATGYLTSASLCVTGAVAEEAARAASEIPHLGVGLHVTLVDEAPAANPGSIPSLLDRNGRLPRTGAEFASRWLAGRIARNELEIEVAAQWERAAELLDEITHFDSHDHVHVVPGIFDVCLREAARHAVRRVRIPFEPVGHGNTSARRQLFGLGLRALSRRAAREATRAGFAFPDAYSGYRGAGTIDTASLIERIADAGPGCTEIGLHPAASDLPRSDMADWGYRWRDEYRASKDPRVGEALDRLGASLASYADLDSRRTAA